jgi:hypothetical protein
MVARERRASVTTDTENEPERSAENSAVKKVAQGFAGLADYSLWNNENKATSEITLQKRRGQYKP